jgi:hypothetical protein
MLRHDSQEAAWTNKDYVHRALDMTYGDGWRPTSKALSSQRFTQAVRVADAIVNHSKWTPDSKTKVELALPQWRNEYQTLDAIFDCPL